MSAHVLLCIKLLLQVLTCSRFMALCSLTDSSNVLLGVMAGEKGSSLSSWPRGLVSMLLAERFFLLVQTPTMPTDVKHAVLVEKVEVTVVVPVDLIQGRRKVFRINHHH